jgi:hypothetical protein
MKKLVQITVATAFAAGLFGSALPAFSKATRAEVYSACGRTKGCKVEYVGDGALTVSVGGKVVGYCPGGSHDCYPTRRAGSKVFPSMTPDENKGHDGGGRSGGDEVGGPSG